MHTRSPAGFRPTEGGATSRSRTGNTPLTRRALCQLELMWLLRVLSQELGQML
jgi:hypothetical protein